MTVIRSLYGVEFSCGKVLVQYTAVRLASCIRSSGSLGTPEPVQAVLTAIGGMHLWRVHRYTVSLSKSIYKKTKKQKNLTVQLVPKDFTKRVIPLNRTHSQAVE